MSSGSHHSSPLGLLGLGLGALAGVLAALAAGYGWAEGPLRFAAGETIYAYPRAVAAVGIVAAVLITATLVMPWLWARLVGIALIASFASAYAALVAVARSMDDFEVDADVSLLTGGQICAAAFGVSAVALTMAMLGGRPRSPAPSPAPAYQAPAHPPADYGYTGRLPPLEAGPAPAVRAGTSGKAITSLVLGILAVVSVIAPPLAALAIVFANLARADIRASGNRAGGGGMATAGLVLGIVGLALSAIILTVIMFSFPPTAGPRFE